MLKQVLEQGREAADAALERLLPPATQHPTSIHQAMRHSVFAGGKRLRPILCMEAGRMIAAASVVGSRTGSPAGSLPTGIEDLGAALEMLHTYSLIHDDLPALDNDDLRRGRPTCHKAFGEAIAILAGDALQTQAYEVLAQIACPAEARVAIIREIAHATGTIDGMIGGQVVDLEAEHKKPDLATLEYIHRSKTAALITASVVSGGMYAGATAADIRSPPHLWPVDRPGVSNRGRCARPDPDLRATGKNRGQGRGGGEGNVSGAIRNRGIAPQGRRPGRSGMRANSTNTVKPRRL